MIACCVNTCACRRVWLPEEATVDLSAGDPVGPLQDVARITLEHHMVPGLPAVPTARPVSRHAGVIAGGCSGDWRSKGRLNH